MQAIAQMFQTVAVSIPAAGRPRSRVVIAWGKLACCTAQEVAAAAISRRKCACGEEFWATEDLETHMAELLTAGTALGTDGYYHAEIFKDCPAPEYPFI